MIQATAPEKVDRTLESEQLWKAERDRIETSKALKDGGQKSVVEGSSGGFFSEFIASPQDDRILIANHGLSNGIQIQFKLGVPSNRLPNPLLQDVCYYLVSTRLNDFKVSLAEGGAPENILDAGSGTNDVWFWEEPQPGDINPYLAYPHDSAA